MYKDKGLETNYLLSITHIHACYVLIVNVISSPNKPYNKDIDLFYYCHK